MRGKDIIFKSIYEFGIDMVEDFLINCGSKEAGCLNSTYIIMPKMNWLIWHFQLNLSKFGHNLESILVNQYKEWLHFFTCDR